MLGALVCRKGIKDVLAIDCLKSELLVYCTENFNWNYVHTFASSHGVCVSCGVVVIAQYKQLFYLWQWFNPFPHINTYWRLCCRRLLKTMWQKEKLLKTSNFSFSHTFFLTLLIIKPLKKIMKIFHVFVNIFLKSSAAGFLYEG